MSPTRTFEITPRGRFSLAEANAFGFGQREAAAGAKMRLAFATDGDWGPVGVELTQDEIDGPVRGVLHGDAPFGLAVAQVERILSLDYDGTEWEAVLEREAPLRGLAEQAPGLRPVLFHSPYEAAAWSVISARIHRRQAAGLRDQISSALGTSFDLHGERMHAFPHPATLLQRIDEVPLNDTKRERLAGVARAALDGLFDVDELHRIGPEAAQQEMLSVKGIGPFYAMLIVVRASGFADVLAEEPRARQSALEAYGLPESTSSAEFAALAERWRPFRTWATVLCRVAVERGFA